MVNPGPAETTIAPTAERPLRAPWETLSHLPCSRANRWRWNKDLCKDLDRVTVDPEVMGGVPCIGGLRIPVSTVVEMTVDGMSYQEIIDEVPLLEAEDIEQGLEYAARAIHRSLARPL